MVTRFTPGGATVAFRKVSSKSKPTSAQAQNGHKRQTRLTINTAQDAASTGEPVAADASVTGVAADASATFKKTLVCVMDENPYLSAGSRQLLATASGLANSKEAQLSVMVVDDQSWTLDNDVRLETIRWHLKENGCEEYELSIKPIDMAEASITLADMADDLDATLLMLATDSVEAGYVDANMLAKFLGCSFLFVE